MLVRYVECSPPFTDPTLNCRYKGKDLVLGNLLKAQQRELDRWMGPLSSVRKRIKSIQDM